MTAALQATMLGWAWRTPLGAGIGEVMDRLYAGQRAVQPNPRFDAGTYACSVAAAIPGEPRAARHARFLRRMGAYAVEVAREALGAAGIPGSARVGLYFGYGGLRAHWDDLMPAFREQQADGADAWHRGLALLHPFWMLRHLSNNAHALAAEELRACGEGATYGGANAGAQALAGALRALAAGAVDTAVVVGYDSCIEPETVVEMAAHGLLAGLPAARVAAPYARAAAGFVPGEAAAAIVLRRSADAGPGHARVQALDAADGAHGAPRMETVRRLLAQLAQGGELIDGAGWAHPDTDLAERAAAAALAGNDALLCCTMGALGQLGAAAPVVQAIALARMLERGLAPPIAGLRDPAPGPLRPLTTTTPTGARAAIGISLGTPGLAGAIRIER